MKSLKEILGEELYKQVNAALLEDGEHVVLVDSRKESTFIPKDRFDEVNNQKKTFKTQNEDLLKQIQGLQEAAKGNEKLVSDLEAMKSKVEEANSKIKQAEEVAAEKVKQAKVDAALDVILKTTKVKDAEVFSLLLKKDNINIDEKTGEVTGLSEQVAELQKSKPFLFEEAQGGNDPKPAGGTGNLGNGGNGGSGKGEKLSVGAMLAKQKAAAANNQNSGSNFFKVE
jgi:alanyl-tRNA synthetase